MYLYNDFDDIKKFIANKVIINDFALSDIDINLLKQCEEWTIDECLHAITGVKKRSILQNLTTQIEGLKRLDPTKLDQNWIVYFIGIDNITAYLKSCNITPYGDYYRQLCAHSESKIANKSYEFDLISRLLLLDWGNLCRDCKKAKKENVLEWLEINKKKFETFPLANMSIFKKRRKKQCEESLQKMHNSSHQT